MARRPALPAQEVPRGERVLMLRWIRMFRCAAVVDCERPHPHRTASFRDHAAMAEDRARAIAAAVKEQQHLCSVASGCERPLAADTVAIDAFAFDVSGHGRGRADLIKPRASLRPAD